LCTGGTYRSADDHRREETALSTGIPPVWDFATDWDLDDPAESFQAAEAWHSDVTFRGG
jgi:hypothetical protein